MSENETEARPSPVAIRLEDTMQAAMMRLHAAGAPLVMETFHFGVEGTEETYPISVVFAQGVFSPLLERAVKVLGESLVTAGLTRSVEVDVDGEGRPITPEKGI